MPHEFLADRNLGKRVVTTLREAGYTVHTLAEVFGESEAQLVTDENWIALAGGHGWAALTKDSRIRQRPAERDAVTTHDVLLFALANANLGFTEMADALLAAMPRIATTRLAAGSDRHHLRSPTSAVAAIGRRRRRCR